MRSDLPEFRDWSIAAVHLLRGVVEVEDHRVWDLLVTNQSQLENYFARIGLLLVVDTSEGFAYLRQLTADEAPPGYEELPKLFRDSRMSYGQTLLCVVLRDALRRFEEEEVRDERCVVTEMELLETWKTFFPGQGDDVRQRRDLHATFNKLKELGFVKAFGNEEGAWEVRRILKARLSADQLERLHLQLAGVAERQEVLE